MSCDITCTVFFVVISTMQEHSPPSTQAIEQVCLSPAITSSNQNSTISFTFTLSSSNFYQPDLNSSSPSVHVTPTPLITQSTMQPFSTVPFPSVTHSATHTPAPSTIASTTLAQQDDGGAISTHSRISDTDSDGDQGMVIPAEGDLPPDSHEHDEHASNAPSPPTVNKDTAQEEVLNSQSENVNGSTVHNDRNEVVPGNQLDSDSVLEDNCYGDPGSVDHINNSNSGSDSDSVIVLQASAPATRRDQSSQPAQLDSSEDFQESPLPKTPKRTAAKKSTPQSYAKKPASRVAAGKRGLTSTASKESPQVSASVAKKMIVTRSVTSSRGSKSFVESGAATRPPREFYSGRTAAMSAARSSKPPQPSTAGLGHGRVTTKPTSLATKATSGATTSTQAAATSVKTPANRPTATTKPGKATSGATTSTQASMASSATAAKTPTNRSTATTKPAPIVASESTTATVQTAPAAKHAPSARPVTPTSTKPTRNTSTKSTPNSSKPSRPTSARPTASTKSARSSKPKENSTTKNSKGNSISGVASSGQSRNSSKNQRKGTKRPLADEAETGATSPRKKARSFEPGSPRSDGVGSEIALHTRGL